MTKQEALSFKRFSVINGAILLRKCPKCTPYKDWFTYARWEAQGKHIAKGQHGTKLTVILETEKEDENGERVIETRPLTATVFCRHQLAE